MLCKRANGSGVKFIGLTALMKHSEVCQKETRFNFIIKQKNEHIPCSKGQVYAKPYTHICAPDDRP